MNIHMMQPRLRAITQRGLHNELADLLKTIKSDNYVSIEVGRQASIDDLVSMMEYVAGVFL